MYILINDSSSFNIITVIDSLIDFRLVIYSIIRSNIHAHLVQAYYCVYNFF